MIPFRTQRLATSVTNRILSLYEGLPPLVLPPGMPSAPDLSALPAGQVIDAKLQQPLAPVDAEPSAADAIALKAGGLL